MSVNPTAEALALLKQWAAEREGRSYHLDGNVALLISHAPQDTQPGVAGPEEVAAPGAPVKRLYARRATALEASEAAIASWNKSLPLDSRGKRWKEE